MGKYIKLFIIIIAAVISFGCSRREAEYTIPENYTAEAVMKVYTDKTENSYSIKILCRDNSYTFSISDGSAAWNIAMLSDKRFMINNENFPEGSDAIEDFYLKDALVYDFNLSKFNNYTEEIPDEIIYLDGKYKHVLSFSKQNLLPKTIFIYKNDILVKTIEYNTINVEKS
jgi:hypothetical protein